MITYSNATPAETPQYAYVAGMEAAERHQTVPGGNASSVSHQTCQFGQVVFPVDQNGTLLRLRSPLTLEFAKSGGFGRFEVKGWGVSMDSAKADELPRVLVRTFLQFLAKADDQRLTDEEQVRWLGILDQVDFTQFSIDRAAPHYVEGRLSGRNPTRVVWADGTTEKLSGKAAGALYALEVGDEFSALAKLGRNNVTLSLDRIGLLTPA